MKEPVKEMKKRLNPDDDSAYFFRGAAHFKFGEYQLAIEDYNEAIRLKPDEDYLYRDRGEAYYKLGQYQRAIEDFNEAIRLNDNDTEAHYHKACCFALQKNVLDAVSCLRSVLKKNEFYLESIRENQEFDTIRNEICFVDMFREFEKPGDEKHKNKK